PTWYHRQGGELRDPGGGNALRSGLVQLCPTRSQFADHLPGSDLQHTATRMYRVQAGTRQQASFARFPLSRSFREAYQHPATLLYATTTATLRARVDPQENGRCSVEHTAPAPKTSI